MARRRRGEVPGQLSFDELFEDPAPSRPSRGSNPPSPTATPPRPPRRRATPLRPPPGFLGGQFDDVEPEGTGEPFLDTRDIAAAQTTGIAQRAIASDIEAEFDMIPIASSRVNEAGYNPALQTIRVRFRDGTPWEYRDVPEDVWQGFKTSDSPGRYIFDVLDSYPYGRGNF